jgi:hypothetical protein
MNQDQQPRPWWKDNRLAWALAALTLAGLLITTILGCWQGWAWTELLWRWIELLIIPVVLGAGAFWFNTQTRRRELEQEFARRKSEQELALQARESEQELAQQERENDREIAKERAREDAFQRYLLIAEQIPNVQVLQSVVDLAVWKRCYQAKLLIGEKAAAFAPGNSTRKAGNSKPSPKH